MEFPLHNWSLHAFMNNLLMLNVSTAMMAQSWGGKRERKTQIPSLIFCVNSTRLVSEGIHHDLEVRGDSSKSDQTGELMYTILQSHYWESHVFIAPYSYPTCSIWQWALYMGFLSCIINIFNAFPFKLTTSKIQCSLLESIMYLKTFNVKKWISIGFCGHVSKGWLNYLSDWFCK